MSRPWAIDTSAEFTRRLGRDPQEIGASRDGDDCPDVWELTNRDVAVIGRDATLAYAGRLPAGVRLGPDERLVVIPGRLLPSLRSDGSDA